MIVKSNFNRIMSLLFSYKKKIKFSVCCYLNTASKSTRISSFVYTYMVSALYFVHECLPRTRRWKMYYRVWGEGNSEKQTEIRCFRYFWNPSCVWTINIATSAKIIAMNFRKFKLPMTTCIFHHDVFDVNTLSTSGRVPGTPRPSPSPSSLFFRFFATTTKLIIVLRRSRLFAYTILFFDPNNERSHAHATRRVRLRYHTGPYVFYEIIYTFFLNYIHKYVNPEMNVWTYFSDRRPCRIGSHCCVPYVTNGEKCEKTTPSFRDVRGSGGAMETGVRHATECE